MTQTEFLELIVKFIKRGYSKVSAKYNSFKNDGSDYFYKDLKELSNFSLNKGINQLRYYIYYTDNIYTIVPVIETNNISLHLKYPEYSLQKCEEYAIKFCKWVSENNI